MAVSTDEIDEFMRGREPPGWRGAMPSDVFQREAARGVLPLSAVVNISPSGSPGTHWVAIAAGSALVYYFSSFGLPPGSEDIFYGELPHIPEGLKALQKKDLRLAWNVFDFQSLTSAVCGKYACLALVDPAFLQRLRKVPSAVERDRLAARRWHQLFNSSRR